MEFDTKGHRSRRDLLFGAAGALAALAAQALGRPAPVLADGETIKVGRVYTTAQSLTRIANETNDENVFSAISLGGGRGVSGGSDSWTGVFGTSRAGVGVEGLSDDAAGVSGYSSDGPGVNGYAYAGPGVVGVSETDRGGRFKGPKAQIRLLPSEDATHPKRGAPGDLFLDASMRLWLCKGGTSWTRVA